ncbi:MAG: hydrogenase 3 maturation endopeptidase HyCI [Anaerolineales bacterium]|nr:hydrogenase 3 maturation endopeptidase HyCI [Anaerolineales bacterium]
MTSAQLWQSEVSRVLEALLTEQPAARVAIFGVGNELAGDDAAGGLVIRRLLQLTKPSDCLMILDGGHAPESFIGKLEAFAPDLVLIVDATDLKAVPGTISLLDMSRVKGNLPSTHTLSLTVLTHYLQQAVACQVYLLGIQPRSVAFDTPLSPVVSEAVETVTHFLSHEANLKMMTAPEIDAC